MVKFHNSDLWIAWMVIFCMEGSRFDLHTGKVCVRALDVTVSQSSIQVARGQAAILPCSFTTSAALNNLNIIWMVIPLSNANQPEQSKQLFNMQLQAVQAHLPPFTLNPGAGRPSK